MTRKNNGRKHAMWMDGEKEAYLTISRRTEVLKNLCRAQRIIPPRRPNLNLNHLIPQIDLMRSRHHNCLCIKPTTCSTVAEYQKYQNLPPQLVSAVYSPNNQLCKTASLPNIISATRCATGFELGCAVSLEVGCIGRRSGGWSLLLGCDSCWSS